MSRSWILILSSVLFSLTAQAQQVQNTGDRSMIEIGAGAFMPTATDPLDAVVRVVFERGASSDEIRYVRVRVAADVAGDAQGVSYLDVRFDALAWYWNDGDSYVGFNTLTAQLQRNIAIDESLTMRVGVLGLRGELKTGADSDTVRFLLGGALDLLALSYTQRLSDKADSGGIGYGGKLEMGAEFSDRLRVVLGMETDRTLSASRLIPDGMDCTSYEDYYGRIRTRCRDTYRTVYDDRRGTFDAYLSVVASLTRQLSLFGRAGYAVYRVNDMTGRERFSSNSAWQFLVGAKYQFQGSR